MNTIRINPAVIHDKIEGEILLLNLETGTYYQLKDEAVLVWEDIVRGASVSDLRSSLGARCGLPPETARASLDPFLLDLQAENIVAPGHATDLLAPALPTSTTPASEFTPPVLVKYTDMQSLLLLDPVHDVDSQGWPKPNSTRA